MLESSGVEPKNQTVLLANPYHDQIHNHLSNSGVNVVLEQELLKENPALLVDWDKKTRAEQLFTLGPFVVLRALEHSEESDWVFYVDADVQIYTSLESGLQLEGKDLVLVPHYHQWWNRKRLAKYGYFNVGIVGFRASESGREMANLWARLVEQWCYDRVEGNKYADQKYLESLANLSSANVEIAPKNYHLAPWNFSFSRVSKHEDGSVKTANGEMIHSFHIQGLKKMNKYWYVGHLPYLGLAFKTLMKHIYIPHVRRIEEIERVFDLSSSKLSRKSRLSRLYHWLGAISGQRVKGS